MSAQEDRGFDPSIANCSCKAQLYETEVVSIIVE